MKKKKKTRQLVSKDSVAIAGVLATSFQQCNVQKSATNNRSANIEKIKNGTAHFKGVK
jgi:hypothetical protein